MHLLVTVEIKLLDLCSLCVFAACYKVQKNKKTLIFSNFPGIWEFTSLWDRGKYAKMAAIFYFKMATIERSIVVIVGI